jgi:hypothetical protein
MKQIQELLTKMTYRPIQFKTSNIDSIRELFQNRK